MGRVVSGEWTFEGNFTLGGICPNSYPKFFLLSYFLFVKSILNVEMLRGIVRGELHRVGIVQRIFPQ